MTVPTTFFLPYQSEDGPIEGTAVIVPVSCPKCGSELHVVNTSRTTTGTQATAVLRCPSCGNHGTEYTVQVFLRALRQPGDPRERPACGTATGYRYHQRHREAPCEACLEAYGRWMNPDNAPIGGGVGGQRKREMMAVET